MSKAKKNPSPATNKINGLVGILNPFFLYISQFRTTFYAATKFIVYRQSFILKLKYFTRHKLSRKGYIVTTIGIN